MPLIKSATTDSVGQQAPPVAAAAAGDAASSVVAAPEPVEVKEDPAELDLVFLVDTTGSMGKYIESAQQNMNKIVQNIVSGEKVDIQVAIVAYRDHGKSEEYVTKISPFTNNPNEMKASIDKLKAKGGGDGPEAITAGLDELIHLNYRPNSTKVAVLIGDAPTHGLGEDGDTMPEDPKGRDPLKICRDLFAKGIVVYSVACEPDISKTSFGRDFFMAVSKMTQGQYMPLSSANLLADVIVGGAKEEISLKRLAASVDKEAAMVRAERAEAAKAKGAPPPPEDDESVAVEVASRLQQKGVQANKVTVDSLYESYIMDNVEILLASESLKQARPKLKKKLNPPVTGKTAAGAPKLKQAHAGGYAKGAAAPPPEEHSDAAGPVTVGGSAQQRAYITKDLVDFEQVARVLNKAKSK